MKKQKMCLLIHFLFHITNMTRCSSVCGVRCWFFKLWNHFKRPSNTNSTFKQIFIQTVMHTLCTVNCFKEAGKTVFTYTLMSELAKCVNNRICETYNTILIKNFDYFNNSVLIFHYHWWIWHVVICFFFNFIIFIIIFTKRMNLFFPNFLRHVFNTF